jgi:DNA cross-link repair 1A protein
VHLVPLGTVSSDRLRDYVARYKSHYTHALAFRPTGWTFSPPAGSDTLPAVAAVIKKSQARGYTHADLRPMRNSTPALALYGVPYSEHSSFFELCCFALSLDWGRIIATVNGET